MKLFHLLLLQVLGEVSGAGGGAEQEAGLVAGYEVVPSKVTIRFEAHDGEIMSARWDAMGRWDGKYLQCSENIC